MGATPAISQRDLRTRSREIMDAVEHGQSFTVTRDGHEIAELVPLRPRRTFVSREQFTALSAAAPRIDLDRFRDDLGSVADTGLVDPYER